MVRTGAGASRVDVTYLLQLTSGPQLSEAFPSVLVDRWDPEAEDLIPDTTAHAFHQMLLLLSSPPVRYRR